MRGDGRIFNRPGTSKWWIEYWANGRQHRESGGRTEAEARKLLRRRLREIHRDEFVGPKAEKATVAELLDSLLVHLETKGVKSATQIRSHLKPVRKGIGHLRAGALTTSDVERYARDRLALGKARATLNRELQPLKQALALAVRQGRLSRVPYVSLLSEDNARQGFFEADEFKRLITHLPSPIDDLASFAYLTGWRRGEILGLRWEAVDRKAREVRLRTSKSGHGRVQPLEGALWRLMERRWSAREFRSTVGIRGLSQYVFHREGQPIGEFRRSWATACRKAKVEGKLFHDLRRTAVRNMIRAGVPQSVVMSLSGHRTVSMFLRYNISSDADRRDALRRLDEHLRKRSPR
jgi:integrase